MKTHPSMRPNRRELLTAIGAIPLALTANRYLRAAERQDVIILGAGLSGLNSALLLEEQGFNVILLEASDHVGGRVQTRMLGGIKHELGASDIGVMYARVLDMMRRLNLERVPAALSIKPFSFHVNDQLLSSDEWKSAEANRTIGDERAVEPSRLQSHLLGLYNPLENLDDWLQPQHHALDIPIAQYLQSQGISDEAIRLFGHTYNGIGVNRTSALSLFRDTTRTQFGIKAFMAMKEAGQQVAPLSQVAGGIQRLPEAMAANLKTEIRFGKAAAAISHDDKGVEVTCNDGSKYRGDFLVSAIPLTALRRIEITPTLSPDKSAIVHQMEYYAVTKFYLRPKTRFWEVDGYGASMWTDGAVERVFAGTDSSGDVHSLLVWITGQGSRRIDQMEPEAAKRVVLDTLARIRPASKNQLEVMGYHSWGRTPYINGCGHSYSAGQIERYAANLPAPEGRIHFAGEHTRRREFGMEAAMASAERVAGEILQVA